MEGDKTTFTISSHNVNGFNRSREFLFGLCESCPISIRAIQEHWLAPPYKKIQGVNRLRSLHPSFDGFGNSAMEKEVNSKIRSGRPYGGTGFLYSKQYSNSIKPLVTYKHERVSAMKLCCNDMEIVLVNAYLPFFNTRDLQSHRVLYADTLAYIETIFNDYAGSFFSRVHATL